MRGVRGGQVGMIFQEPMTSLNPVFTIGRQIEEVLVLHQKLAARPARAQALELLERVGIPSPERRVLQYPHELSGGMKQRVMIAMASRVSPKALDRRRADHGARRHDPSANLGASSLSEARVRHGRVAHYARPGRRRAFCGARASDVRGQDRRAGLGGDVFKRAAHPYTQALLGALPDPLKPAQRLEAIPGRVPSPLMLPPGCAFCARCKYAFEPCPSELPALYPVASGHHAACFLRDPKRAASAPSSTAQ